MTDRDLFIAALEQPEADRQAWLDRTCAGDADLRRRLDVLLRAHELASQFLASPAVEPLATPVGSTRGHDPCKDDENDVLALLAPPDKPGQLGKLAHYEILEVVGKGSMGVVVKAFDPKLHRIVAIKLMVRHLAANPAARKRFEREARAVAAVRDDHVVAIHNVETGGPMPYLVMEFIGGTSLQERLDRHGPLGVKEILRIGMQAAQGLAAAHAQGLVHRDVKPANILLENGVERVKITDFGLARAVDDVNLTQSGMITGTPNYMSPEQADGRPVDARSDLFSLGSVLYALAAGHPPFRADGMAAVLKRVAADPPRPVRDVNPDVPEWLEAIVQKLHEKDPAGRFQTASEVAELLEQHLAHLQQPTKVPRPAGVAVPTPAVEVGKLSVWHVLWPALLAGLGVVEVGFFLDLANGSAPPSAVPTLLAIGLPLCLLWLFLARRRQAAAVRPAKPPRPRRNHLAVRGGICLLLMAVLAFVGFGYLIDLNSSTLSPPAQRLFLGVVVLLSLCGLVLLIPPRGRKYLLLAVVGIVVVIWLLARAHERPVATPASVPANWHQAVGTLKVTKDDPAVQVLVTLFGNRLAETRGAFAPAGRSTQTWELPGSAAVRLRLGRNGKQIHQEDIDIHLGKTREVHVPTVVLPERTVTLVPKEGAFPNDVTRMLIAPDRASIAAERLDGSILIFDASSGKERFTIPRPKSDSPAFAFTPDGKNIAYLTRTEKGDDIVLRAINVRDRTTFGKELKRSEGPLVNAHALAFSPDGKRLVVSGADKPADGRNPQSWIYRWEWPGGKELPIRAETQPGTIVAMQFTPDGTQVLAVSERDLGCNWNWSDGRLMDRWDVDAKGTALYPLAMGPRNDTYSAVTAGLHLSTKQSSLHFWSWRKEGLIRHEAVPVGPFGSLAVSPDGERVAGGILGTASDNWERRAAVRVWDVRTGKERGVLLGHFDWVLDVAFTPEGEQLVSASKDGTVRWWDVSAVRP